VRFIGEPIGVRDRQHLDADDKGHGSVRSRRFTGIGSDEQARRCRVERGGRTYRIGIYVE
jgi:hypothetical protein